MPDDPAASADGARRHDPLALSATALAVAAFAACLAGWRAGGGAVDLPWAPALDLRLAFGFDGIGALYGLLATGIGATVFAYAARYLPLHLAHQDRPAREHRRFWPWMALFLLAMVGLASAQDLILLFVLFDVTTICSYFLIGFDRGQRPARMAAQMALVVTGASAVALLIGALLLYGEHGTFAIPQLAEAVGGSGTDTLAAALIAVAALAKSAQVPLHFWLPRAMVAPTPVSAYLHSAAMVAAGVLVLGRLHQLLAPSEVVLDGLLVVGLASIALGSVLALAADELKQVLASSTIAQYGYVVALYGIGGRAAAGAAAFWVIAHALAKSALFLVAGAVTMATGAGRLSQVGGLARRMPWLAAAGAVAAAALAGLPLTVGYFKDELLFRATAEEGTALAVAMVLGAGLTLAYTARFWAGIFLGRARGGCEPIPRTLVAAPALLALAALAGGVLPGPFATLAQDAAQATVGGAASVSVAYRASTETLMALAAWGAGALVLVALAPVRRAATALQRAGDRVGPRVAYERGIAALNRLSDAVHRVEVRDLRSRLAAVFVPGGVLVALGFAVTPTSGAFRVGGVDGEGLLLISVLALTAVAALAVTLARQPIHLVLGLAVVGFSLAIVYALVGAPDVALVAVLVETFLTLVFLAIVSSGAARPRDGSRRSPRDERRGTARRLAGASHGRARARWRNPLAGLVGGLAAFAVIWAALSRPAATDPAADRLVAHAPELHAPDVVTAILAGFRGLDTLGEITVVAIAVLGVIGFLRRGRAW